MLSEPFYEVSKCDMCAWQGMNKDKGPHTKQHLKEIDQNIIDSLSNDGTPIEAIMSNTGYKRERVRNRLRLLANEGRIGLEYDKLVAYLPTSKKVFNEIKEGTVECTACNQIKLITAFPFRDKKAKKRHSRCGSCKNKYNSTKNLIKTVDINPKPVVSNEISDWDRQIHEKAEQLLIEKHRTEYDLLVQKFTVLAMKMHNRLQTRV